jgi:twitching motility protein PilT
MMNISELLHISVQQSASDLHLSADMPPIIRVDGELRPLTGSSIMTEEILGELLYSLMSEKQRQDYEAQLTLDFAFEIPDLSRFRVNIFKQNRGIAAVFRVIPTAVKTLETLGLPPLFKELCHYTNGLVLITGATGSGKTTTLASMIDYINNTRPCHILTIEDPIEFIHTSKKALINQREIYRDVTDFNTALRSALREDPDVILIGELRDLETIRLALTAAETGHLVFATVHTTSAAKTIARLVDVFPGDEKPMVRALLAETLQAVIAQTLVKKTSGGRTAALETMLCTPAIRNLIREDKTAQMYSVIQTSADKGMKTLDQHLKELVTAGIITPNESISRCQIKTSEPR